MEAELSSVVVRLLLPFSLIFDSLRLREMSRLVEAPLMGVARPTEARFAALKAELF